MRYPSSSSGSNPLQKSSVSPMSVDLRCIVERSLREILLVCQEACAARQCAPKGSAEWHKRTGEILACSKFTSILYELQASIPPPESH
jgi:hypothetical protein